MPIDFGKPATTDNYSTAFVPNIIANQKAMAQMLDPTYAGVITGGIAGIKRLNAGVFEQYDGTTWQAYPLNYIPKGGTPSHGSYQITTTGNSYAGFSFSGSYAVQEFLVTDVAAGMRKSGVYSNTLAAWDWRWDDGTLTFGTVPYARLSGTPDLSVYAPKASPTFTGIPAAPTAAPGTSTTQLATTAFVQNAVSGGTGGYAPLANPTFTGIPAAPTAAAGTNTTQLATTAFAATAAANAAASAVASYAPLANAGLTGVPTAPTATAGTATTQLATTAFVGVAVANGVANYAPKASPTFSGNATFAAGSAAAPGIGFTGATTTGLFVTTTTLKFTGNGVQTASLDAAGNFIAVGNVTAYSDERLKENFSDSYLSLQELLGLGHFSYTRKGSGVRQVGVKAQQVHSVLPLAVTTDEEGFMSVDYGRLATAASLSLARTVAELQREVRFLRRDQILRGAA